ncbi:hypothetical protein E3P80_00472 [Wallemia ichthyophaga]|nr:hypothetical protein E3P82_00472 [Wallemia ichthyophaga]TIB56515.1 hypothetical protein E3P80_00472 [Wallemia ichthyophaga]TIB61444.1 hypothetical protein E3P79_00473 [Wallemia ichthyophaga]
MILRDNHIIASAITSPWNVAYSLHSQASHSNLIINIHSPVKVKFAIHRIHVINKHRRQRLGLLLLNSIAQNQVYGYTLSPNQIAFSQPTTAGSCLASSWFNINSNTSKALSYLSFLYGVMILSTISALNRAAFRGGACRGFIAATSTVPLKTHSHLRQLSTVNLAYEKIEGSLDSEPIVVCHGLMGSKQNWRTLARNMATKTHSSIYTLDLRNHGTSPHATPHDYAHMAADVSQFIESHNLHNVTLLGHSMGGKVVMALALAQPHLLRRLIVADMSPQRASISEEFLAYTQTMVDIEHANVRSKKEADEMLKKVESNMAIRQFLLTNAEMNKDTGFYKFRIPVDILRDSIDAIGDFPFGEQSNAVFDKPTTFIKGEHSSYLNHKNIPLVKRFFPNMQLHTLNAGHFVHTEKPADFVELVREAVENDRAL